MSPEVAQRKLGQMATYLKDLQRHEGISFELFMERHYEIERILELLVVTASDIVLHLISLRGEAAPASYRAAFLRAGENEIISAELSKRLALSAGLRNILVHEYEEIDYSILHKCIPAAIADFSNFLHELS